MRLSMIGLSMVLCAAGCGGPSEVDPGCRCEGAVPEGTLSVACGQSQCVGGAAGYRCVAANSAVSAPEACAVVDPDAGAPICACDATAGCDDGCACDAACMHACACDASAGCDTGCSCDPECAEAGCPDWTVGDGYCDCGCGTPDADCPTPLTTSDCSYTWCAAELRVDPSDPSRCIAPPEGWTCPGSWLDNGYCDCGCGIVDPECEGAITVDDCLVPNGCAEGMRPDPSDPTRCIANPAGWTCEGLLYDNGSCNCGCGILDPDCSSPLRVQGCTGVDGCPSGEGPSPIDPTQCIADPPQDDWTCDLALLYDGASCDCGCGALDPDCAPGATASSCDVTHCATRDELDPSSIAICRERCTPSAAPVGDARCTNGGSVSFGGFACAMNLSRCDDFHRYEVECDGGSCVCRVDGSCVLRNESGFCGGVQSTLNGVCGWSLIDARP